MTVPPGECLVSCGPAPLPCALTCAAPEPPPPCCSAYYIRTANAAGLPSDPTKWVVFMEGGGWASSLHASVGRAKTGLGSSKDYGPDPGRIEGLGMFGAPPFDTHTVVYVKYW